MYNMVYREELLNTLVWGDSSRCGYEGEAESVLRGISSGEVGGMEEYYISVVFGKQCRLIT